MFLEILYETLYNDSIGKNKDELELWNVNETLNLLTGYKKEFFSYVADSNTNGNLPTYKDLKNNFNISFSNMSPIIRSLLENNMIINPSIIEIASVLGYQKNCKYKLPEKFEKIIPRFKKINGKCGKSFSWEEKFNNSKARSYERYLIALAETDGIPVYSKVFYE